MVSETEKLSDARKNMMPIGQTESHTLMNDCFWHKAGTRFFPFPQFSLTSVRYISINQVVLDFFTDTTSFQMKAPIIVNGHGDVSIFESVEYAEQYLEPIDVKNKEYVVYDSEGHLLKLVISKKELPFIFGRTEFIETVRISAIGSGSDHSNELRKLLIKFFQETRAVVEESDLLSLRELVNKSVSIYGFSQ